LIVFVFYSRHRRPSTRAARDAAVLLSFKTSARRHTSTTCEHSHGCGVGQRGSTARKARPVCGPRSLTGENEPTATPHLFVHLERPAAALRMTLPNDEVNPYLTTSPSLIVTCAAQPLIAETRQFSTKLRSDHMKARTCQLSCTFELRERTCSLIDYRDVSSLTAPNSSTRSM
jgi:hypothetical protein